MLCNLHITHYALIEHLDIDFTDGFSVITGETGAGKSIILGALGLLMGGRSDAKAIKPGQKKCCIEATLDIHELGLANFFVDNDIDFDGTECILRREVSMNGKSRAFINDTPVSVTLLRSLTSSIIDIHSQHQNLLLMREHFLLDVLDTVGHHTELRQTYAAAYGRHRTAQRELEALQRAQEEQRAQRDFLQFQYDQLQEAELDDEDEQTVLEEESRLLGNAEGIKSALYETAGLLSDEGGRVAASLRSASGRLDSIAEVYAPASDLSQRLDSCRIELEDIAAELERGVERVEFDPARQTYVDDRLAVIYDLEKRHQVTSIAELIAAREALQQQLGTIDGYDEQIAAARQQQETAYQEMMQLGRELTERRREAAREAAAALRDTLVYLSMPAVSLEFQLSARPAPDATGCDNLLLLFSANRNMPPQDVAQIASGGEIARLMLALKAYVSENRHLPSIIFDEIDTGVSGTVAEKMADVMGRMSAHCQVICITHLPQIAARGRQHYRVYKTDSPEGTTSHITLLDAEERVREVAGMLSGAEMTTAAIDNAKALLRGALPGDAVRS
jgi:DNA repair protein RecN (Recombination protein N)